jgi:hypothetical protein
MHECAHKPVVGSFSNNWDALLHEFVGLDHKRIDSLVYIPISDLDIENWMRNATDPAEDTDGRRTAVAKEAVADDGAYPCRARYWGNEYS